MTLWRLHVDVADQPGQLGALAAAIGGSGANIVSLHVVGEPGQDGAVTDELLVKVPVQLPVRELVAAGRACEQGERRLHRQRGIELTDLLRNLRDARGCDLGQKAAGA